MRALACGAALLLLPLAGLVAGCSVERRLKRVEEQLGAAGLHVEGFHKVAPDRLGAAACRTGKIARLDALVCSYEGAEALARGRRVAEGWVGLALTGSWVDRKLGSDEESVLIVLADRDRVDLEGAVMSSVLAAFDAVK